MAETKKASVGLTILLIISASVIGVTLFNAANYPYSSWPSEFYELGLSWNTTSCINFHSVNPLDNTMYAYAPDFSIFKGKTGTVMLNVVSRRGPMAAGFGIGQVETNTFNITLPTKQLFDGVNVAFEPSSIIMLRPNQAVQVKMSLTVDADATVTGFKSIQFTATSETNGTHNRDLEVRFNVNLIDAPPDGTVYIRGDGTIEGTNKISREGNIYTLNDNIETPFGILVEKDNIVLDGKGYMVSGSGATESNWTTGVDLAWKRNVTVTNLRLRSFDIGASITNAFDNTIAGCDLSNNSYGVKISLQSTGNHIKENNITSNSHHGVSIQSKTNTISNNYIADNKGHGIYLLQHFSSFGTVTGNKLIANVITNNQFGIYVNKIYRDEGLPTVIQDNTLTANVIGINLEKTTNNTLRNNTISNNKWNLNLDYNIFTGYNYLNKENNDIDELNTIDGKIIVYWRGQQNRAVPPNAGYVFLLECKNITIQNLNLTNNQQGILLISTQDSTITNNHIGNNTFGIVLDSSINNKITANQISNNNCGIQIRWNSIHNTIAQNNITQNVYGLQLDRANKSGTLYDEYDGHKNNIIENNIANNEIGIFFWPSSGDNTIQHNNFIDNQKHFENSLNTLLPINNWSDRITGGNFWSDYTGNDANNDGKGDIPYNIDYVNKDDYPLIKPF